MSDQDKNDWIRGQQESKKVVIRVLLGVTVLLLGLSIANSLNNSGE